MIVTKKDQISEEESLSWLGKPYSIDVETHGLNYMTDALIGVALYVNKKSYYFVLEHSTGNEMEVKHYMSPDEIRVLLTPLMTQKNVVPSLHNSKFDLHFFSRYGMPLRGKMFDTLIAAQALNENRRNDLKSLTALVDEDFSHVNYASLAEYDQWPKDHPFSVPLDKFADYAEKDVIVTFGLWEKFRDELRKDSFKGRSMQDAFNEVLMPMIPVLQEMEAEGFRVDVEGAKKLREKYIPIAQEKEAIVQKSGYEMLASLPIEEIPNACWEIIPDEDLESIYEGDDGERYIDKMISVPTQYGDEWIHETYYVQTNVYQPTAKSKPRRLTFNVGSADQLLLLVMRDVKLPPYVELTRSLKSQTIQVNYSNLMTIKFYMGEDTPQYIDAVLEWRKASKFVTTYLDMFVNKTDDEGRLHGFFSMAVTDAGRGGTATGRLSSSNP